MSELLWSPSAEQIAATRMMAFIKMVNDRYGLAIQNTDELHHFSLERQADFWLAVKDFSGLKAQTWGDRVLVDGDKMPGAKFFPDAKLNYAENLLSRNDDTDAIVFRSENGTTRRLSWAELQALVSRLQQVLKDQGVGEGDRVCGYLPNMPETIVAMLAVTSLGATWSSTSPDFGVNGVLDRFGQIEPKVVFVTDGYFYNGKRHDVMVKNAEILAKLPTVQGVVILPYTPGDAVDASTLPNAVTLNDALADKTAKTVEFTHVASDAPLYIMFSSGTTGAPKCMIHSVGGTLLKHATEQILNGDMKAGDRVFFFTTCGWMMWNWLVGVLAWEVTCLLFDGAPSYPDLGAMFKFAEDEKMTFLGTSAKFIDALMKAGAEPGKDHDLSQLRVLTSTGSPLAPEAWAWIYQKVKKDLHLVSFSGGTDIVGTFCGGDPTKPVYKGEIQGATIGVALDCYDDEGNSIRGEKGELVCTKPFPSMPTGFLNDPDGARYRSAYYEQFPNIWTHGDYIEINDRGGVVIHGRSDATLNPGGVRIGTAEIYNQVEKLDEVIEGLVIGQQWDNDVRVVLFVRVAGDLTLDAALTKKIQSHIRATCTPRHVPAKVIQVTDIPRTKSGKITELAVRDVVHGRGVKNKEALANPEALQQYENLDVLQS